MCMDVRKTCVCGANTIQFHLRDNILLPEVINRVFCPNCPGHEAYDRDCMLQDNGWIIEYDMQLATFLACEKLAIPRDQVTPEFLFDQGYACWLEMYPGEKEEIRAEKEAILSIRDHDQTKYLQMITTWNIERVNRLKTANWRKALRA